MAYTVVGTGRQFPKPVELKGDTAAEALNKWRATMGLCEHVAVLNDDRQEVGIAELERLAEEEQAAARRALRGDRPTWENLRAGWPQKERS